MSFFLIRHGRLFTLVQDSEEYILFPPNHDPNSNIIIVVTAPLRPGTAVSCLTARKYPRLCWGARRGGVMCNNGYLISVAVVVVFVVIGVVPIPEFNPFFCLREAVSFPSCVPPTRNPHRFCALPSPPFHGNGYCITHMICCPP